MRTLYIALVIGASLGLALLGDIGLTSTQAAGQAVEEHPHAARFQQLGDSIGVAPGLAAGGGAKAADVLGSG